jgi:hypothetical protein
VGYQHKKGVKDPDTEQMLRNGSMYSQVALTKEHGDFLRKGYSLKEVSLYTLHVCIAQDCDPSLSLHAKLSQNTHEYQCKAQNTNFLDEKVGDFFLSYSKKFLGHEKPQT